MPLPKFPNFDERQTQIAMIAAELFAAKGYHGTPIIDIAKASGTAKTRLYHYFDSKEDLLFSLLKTHAELLKSQLAEPLEGDGPAKDRLLAYTKMLLQINIRSRHQHAIILSELDKLPLLRRAEITSLLRAPIEGLYDLLAEINPGLAKNKSARFPAAMLLLGMINWSHTWFDHDGPLNIDSYANMICETFLGGFAQAKLGVLDKTADLGK